MAAEHTRAARFQANMGGLVLFCVINAFLIGPLLRLCPPDLLAYGGLGTGGAAFIMFEEWVSKPNTRDRKWKLALLSAAFGIGTLVWAVTIGIHTSHALDRDCKLIQDAMLKGVPASAAKPLGPVPSPADQFQALGCRPQM